MRLIVIICLLIFQLSLSTFLEVSNAVECRNGEGASKIAYTLTVSQSGGDNFTTVQDAVNAVPTGNDQWIRIFVNSGVYREQVKIPRDKECIVLEGQSEKETIITFDAYFQTDDSPTFVSMASNFVAKSITFKNTFNEEGERLMSKENKQAVAISVYGDKSAFHSCDFVGFQDTIWDVQGRHFFNSCYIEGAIDFIWGNGQSVYEDCQINVTGDGFITAQGRTAQTDPSGFVFIRGQVVGTGKAYLGRAYDAFSRVIYQFTSLSEVINPLGWDSWKFAARTADLTFAEVKCTGVGANNSSRVEWEKKLEATELAKYTREAFIDQDGWIAQQP